MGTEGIGNTILKLRRKKGITQEVLADFIGVTKTSVSKWENGATLPDIQILPLLASYFEVTVDELIGYVPMLGKEQIRFHYQRLAEAFAARPFGEVLSECDEMIRKYYSCYPFLQQMVVLLINHQSAADTEQNREAAVKMSFDLCGHILADCQEPMICKNVVNLKGMLNLMQGRADLVLEEIGEDALRAEGMEDAGMLLATAYLMAGDQVQARRAAQIGMYRSLMGIVEYGTFLLGIEKEVTGNGREVLRRMDGIMESFALEGLSPNAVGKYEYQAAVYLAGKLGGQQTNGIAEREEDAQDPEEEIFRRLESFVSACGQLFADGIKLHGDSFFNLLDDWFEEMTLGTTGVRSGGSVRESILQGLQNPLFSVLKDQERLKRLLKQWGQEPDPAKKV